MVVDVRERRGEPLIPPLLSKLKARKGEEDGRWINSLASGRALPSVQPQHFQADYLETLPFSI